MVMSYLLYLVTGFVKLGAASPWTTTYTSVQVTHLLTILLMLAGARVLLMGSDSGDVSPVCIVN